MKIIFARRRPSERAPFIRVNAVAPWVTWTPLLKNTVEVRGARRGGTGGGDSGKSTHVNQCIPPRPLIYLFWKKSHSCCFFSFFFFLLNPPAAVYAVEQVRQPPIPSHPIPLRPVPFHPVPSHPVLSHPTSSHPVPFHLPLAATWRATRTRGRVWLRLSWRRRWGEPRSPRRWRVPSRSWRCPLPTTSRARRSAWTVGTDAAGARRETRLIKHAFHRL